MVLVRVLTIFYFSKEKNIELSTADYPDTIIPN